VIRIAEWLALGALALWYVVPAPVIAFALALPAGWVACIVMRLLLRPLEGLAAGDEEVPISKGEDGLRLLIGGSQWMARTDYLGGPIRIAAALAVFLPGIPASNGGWMAAAGLALAVLASVFVIRHGKPSRTKAAVLRAPALWLSLALAANSIVMAGSAFFVAAAFLLAALSAVAWWKLERRRAGMLAAVGGSVA
jgi:hypothetical protein